jgi:hypothetical protein
MEKNTVGTGNGCEQASAQLTFSKWCEFAQDLISNPNHELTLLIDVVILLALFCLQFWRVFCLHVRCGLLSLSCQAY